MVKKKKKILYFVSILFYYFSVSVLGIYFIAKITIFMFFVEVLHLKEQNLLLENVLSEKEKDCAEMKSKIDELNDKFENFKTLEESCSR